MDYARSISINSSRARQAREGVSLTTFAFPNNTSSMPSRTSRSTRNNNDNSDINNKDCDQGFMRTTSESFCIVRVTRLG